MEASIAEIQKLETPKVALSRLKLNAYNARKFDNPSPERQAALQELATSIAEKGIIQPLLVRVVEGEHLEIIAGERRYRAAQIAIEKLGLGADEFMVPVALSDSDDADAYEKMLIENDQRENLSPLERAESFKRYLDERGQSPEALCDLSGHTGIPAHAIRRTVALLALPQAILEKWHEGEISQSHVELFTRLSGEDVQLRVLTRCLQEKWSARRLREAIENDSPALSAAKFDRSECATCPHNTGLISNLFADAGQDEKCSNPRCYETKQGDFFSANWQTSKAKEILGTNGFRFAHRTGADEREQITGDTHERCLKCPEYVSIVDITGQTAKGGNKVCVGTRKCFEELYAKPEEPKAAPEAPQEKPQSAPERAKSSESGTDKAEEKKTAESDSEKAKRAEAKSQKRALEAREAFFRDAIPSRIEGLDAQSAEVIRLAIIGLILDSSAAREAFAKATGLGGGFVREAEAVSKAAVLADADLMGILKQMVAAPVMKDNGFQQDHMPQVRRTVAGTLGIDLKSEWTLNEDYLKKLSQAEVVAMGEEEGIKLWDDEKILAYRDQHHPKKGWRSLKKGELLECITKSGAELTGKTPQEVLKK